MTPLRTPPLSLYVHFPWCVRKCPYCDFNSYTLRGTLPETQYLEALERDLESQANDVRDRTITSVFFGGGTPSLFAPQAIARVLDAAHRHLDVDPSAEVTLEANPGTIERGRFTEYRAAGVTRVSLGAQTFDPRHLEALGRIHSAQETRRAAEELHAAGIANFNLDLMYALPGQDRAGALHDVEQALALAPKHVSHYQLTLEPGTEFAARPPVVPADDVAADMLAACQERLACAGFVQYEVSGYAIPGHECRHNLNYWTFGDYLGVGAGAHGKLTERQSRTIVRTTQLREPRRYQTASPHAISRRTVPFEDLPFEFMMNALRLSEGFEVEAFGARTGVPWDRVAPQLQELQSRGLVALAPRHCRPTAMGLRFLNDVLLAFLPESTAAAGKHVLSTAS
jgi:putative oxygen-independent coproporphyrinogen III oxidase